MKQKVSSQTKKDIERLGIEGIGFEPQEDRVYPEGSEAAHLLGFVGKNDEGADVGYFGLEGYYDLSLSSKPGYQSEEKDAKGIPILLGGANQVSAIRGIDLLTHIDKTAQKILDEKLLEESISILLPGEQPYSWILTMEQFWP